MVVEQRKARLKAREPQAVLPWVQVCPAAPYFVTDHGDTWTPIGQNDAITWPEFQGLYKRRDLATAEAYIKMLSEHGVTCLRLMLEYSQGARHQFERPVGRFRPEMIQLWDDLFGLCEQYGLRILLTPFDTFWLWIKWKNHPYNKANGGPCAKRSGFLLCPDTRERIKARLRFAVERWGKSGALFAWDLWNEIHPSYAHDSAECFTPFIEELSTCVRTRELELYGRSHPQTVSVFGPHMVLDKHIPESIFRHPSLDFASTHFYEEGTIDHPKNTVDAALSTGRLMRDALAELHDRRPFMDSEHGPIHTFKDHHRTLPEPFDDEYFRHIQWAHLCAGGAGGGMRWPNRRPHSLTPGMRKAQLGLARFLPVLDWKLFNRRNWNEEAQVDQPNVKVVACGAERQALVWMIRTDRINNHGMVRRDAEPLPTTISLPLPEPGRYRVTAWDTLEGDAITEFEVEGHGTRLVVSTPPLVTDMAIAIRHA
jgi:hypothetical protein